MRRASLTVALLKPPPPKVHPLLSGQLKLTPAAMSNTELAAPAGANSCAGRVRRVQHELRRGKPPGADHPVWEHFSVCVKEACTRFSILCLMCGRLMPRGVDGSFQHVGERQERADVPRGRQPQGFLPEKLMATTLDPRTNIFYGFEGYEHEGLWTIVSQRAGQAGATPSPAVSGVRREAHAASREAHAASASASEQPRTGVMAASMEHAGKPSSAPSPLSSQDATVEHAVEELGAFKQMPSSLMGEDDHNAQKIFLDPLQWWASMALDFLVLSRLARRVLAIPASQAQSE